MAKTRMFQIGNSQALRIPQELRSDRKEYYISRIGETYIAYPVGDPWFTVRQVIGTFPDDFMSDREQPSWTEVPAREKL